jgi:signal transduction histidine kinase
MKQLRRPKGNERALGASESLHKPASLKWSGLQFRMAAYYALTTVVAVLLIEIVLSTVIVTLLAYGPLADDEFTRGSRETAQTYAFAAAVQATGGALDPNTTFEQGRASSLTVIGQSRPGGFSNIAYVGGDAPDPHAVTFGLLIAPDGRVIASSYPAEYPVGVPVARLLPGRADLIGTALAGIPGSEIQATFQGRIADAAQTVWTKDRRAIGAVYVQVPEFPGGVLYQGFGGGWIVSGIFWLLLMLPVGALFGLITTRGLVRRLRNLVRATTRFADGDYSQRVPVSRRDEVGQLEEQFNRMAEQLAESITQRQALAGENARLAERSRIARDLHDSVKQQVFAVSMQLGAGLSLIERDPEGAIQHLQEADNLAYNIGKELPTLIQELRPLALQDKPLNAALQEYVTSWSRQHGIVADVRMSDVELLPQAGEDGLWRVAQEALSNVARHSGASRVAITLDCEQGKVVLSISDNGKGFDLADLAAVTDTAGIAVMPDKVTRTSISILDGAPGNGDGVGLHSMQERMEELGGTVTIESKAGEGTRILAQCPRLRVGPGISERAGEALATQRHDGLELSKRS